MKQFHIKTVNAIAQEGLALFTDRFKVSAEEANPEGIVVRSTKIDLAPYADLLAIARAGAGVNNIPVDEATDKGICVFNTPGANANKTGDRPRFFGFIVRPDRISVRPFLFSQFAVAA